jgi:CDK-activating kinase assembly factor MAT1
VLLFLGISLMIPTSKFSPPPSDFNPLGPSETLACCLALIRPARDNTADLLGYSLSPIRLNSMSRAAQSKPMPAAKSSSGMGMGDPLNGEHQLHDQLSSLRVADNNAPSESCPVCKSSRYLNSKLAFKINPECYHKMCESCVDRIFANGPAQCPMPGCSRTLRKHRFKTQTFEDLRVEREVDIRKKVALVFNKREEDFEDLRAYNDYLNDVEDITFNLIEGIDVAQSEARLESYRTKHADEIATNQHIAKEEVQSFEAHQKQEEHEARMRRKAARREEEDERREAAESKRDMLNRLAAGTEDAETIAKEGQQVQLKKRMDRQAAADKQRRLQAAAENKSNGSSNIVVKGLKSRKAPEPDAPIDPFGGLRMDGHSYYNLQDDYSWSVIQSPRDDKVVRAGGYDVMEQFGRRALCESFAGLGVFVADETTEGVKSDQDDRVAGTRRAALGAKDVKMQDVS